MNIQNRFRVQAAAFAATALFLGGFNLAYANPPASLPEQALAHIAVCPPIPGAGQEARCHARVVSDKQGAPQTKIVPAGYGPAQLQGAYSLTGLTSNKTIAIVDAYDQPYVKSDLDKYDSTFGLPSFPTCANASSTACFLKVNQNAQVGNYPTFNAGWGLEISLDVQVAHAICPGCKIILVEANSNSLGDLLTAEDSAIVLGANVVSNSWGASEFSTESSYDAHFNRPGVAITFSTGDNGFGVQYPAASQYVTAVGGTTLTVSQTNQYVSESAWSGAGSGCSKYEQKPSWQTDSGCANRTVADVSAVANPSTGAAIYDSCYTAGRRGSCSGGWFQVGGTSLASPIIAGIYALAGDVTSAVPANSLPYTRLNYGFNLHDVSSGSNGNCGTYLCTSGLNYDGPTGLGSPLGITAF